LSVAGNAFISGQVFRSSGSYTPTFGGYSVSPTVEAYYVQIGQWVCVYLANTGAGSSNSTTHTVTVPITSTVIFGQSYNPCGGYALDNGAVVTTQLRCDLPSNSNTVTVFKDMSGPNWTASGGGQTAIWICYFSD